MRVSIRSSVLSRIAGAVAALCLCGGGAAWAGDGADLASLQSVINGFCPIFGMGTAAAPCPQLPTITQAVLEGAGLGNTLPEMLRAQNSIPPGSAVTTGNAAAVPPCPDTPMPFPLDASTTPQLFGTTTTVCPRETTETVIPGLLTTLTPLAFISQNSATAVNALGVTGTGQATLLSDNTADNYVYAVGVSTSFGDGTVKNELTVPDAVYFFYEDLLRNNQNFSTSQIVAKFQFPVTVLNSNGLEGPIAVPTTLQFMANSNQDCSTSSVVGDFQGTGKPQTVTPPNKIGIDCAVRFSASPISASPHAIFEVKVPLLVTGACILPNSACPTGETPPGPNTDPAYFWTLHHGGKNPINTGVYTAFFFDDIAPPTQSGILATGASAIGLAPSAAPFCTTTTCPAPTIPPTLPPPGSIIYSLCASLPTNTNGNGAQLRPAVGAYYGLATSGEMFLSAPLPAAFAIGGTPPLCNPL